MSDQLKERFFNVRFVNALAEKIVKVDKTFNKKDFTKQVLNAEWNAKELKQRVRHISMCLNDSLSGSYEEKIKTLTNVAPHFSGFVGIIFPDFVEFFGLQHYQTSIQALEYFTPFSSSEFAIRPFILNYEKETMAQLLKWSKHKNHHVRRLASEGCRPMLPWAVALPKFKKDPSGILPILENLKEDSEDYVYRSVANNLNDISKHHPELVLSIAKKWESNHPSTKWILKHACRTLLKKGNKKALAIFGLKPSKHVSVKQLEMEKAKIKIGEKTFFSFSLFITKKEKIRLEYAVDYVKSNDSLSRKIFQIAEREFLSSAKPILIKKSHSFKQMTTRKHYPGKHFISIIINGEEKAKTSFILV